MIMGVVTVGAPQLVEVGVAGLLAGAINAIAGGGALITFPVLVAVGLPALAANVTNTVGQCPGYASIVAGYRLELGGQRRRMWALGAVGILGAGIGVVLLKVSSPATFRAIVPWLILGACGLLALQPALRRRLAVRATRRRGPPLLLGVVVLAASAYGAYFGAALGVLLLAALAVALADRLQRLNALNRFVVLVVNLVAAAAFAVTMPVNWTYAAVLAGTTLVGGHAGVTLARRLSERMLRAVVITLGIAAAIYLFVA